jgi:hypothetical protein
MYHEYEAPYCNISLKLFTVIYVLFEHVVQNRPLNSASAVPISALMVVSIKQNVKMMY